MNESPSFEEFQTTATDAFGFLLRQGFEAKPSRLKNDFAVTLQGSSVSVHVEGINWGFGLQVWVEVRGRIGHVEQGTPLWALVKFLAPARYQKLHRGSQLDQIRAHAAVLKDLWSVIAANDFDAITQVEGRFSEARGYDLGDDV